jgi:non-heme chloroperoxidase
MSTITTKDGTQIYYKDWGEGQPLVFHHGWPLSADDWDAQIVPFAVGAARSIKLLKHGTLKAYPGFPHGMPTTNADEINADLLAFIKGEMAATA